MTLDSNRTLGGVGAILLAIPFLNLVGIILVLIAMQGLAEYYNEDDIFQNAIYGFLFGIIGVVALIVVIIMLVIGVVGIGLFIIGLVVMYIFSFLGAIFYRKSLNILSEKSAERIFETAGLVLLIGAVIPIIGEILRFIAWILAAVGFFSIKTPTTQPPMIVPTPPPAPPPSPLSATPPEPAVPVSVSVEKMYCRYCGTENKTDAIFCVKCGTKIAE